MLANVAELGAGRMEETVGKVGCRDAAIVTGIATDKMLALTGQTPAFQIANVVMPGEADARNGAGLHDKLDAIAARVSTQQQYRLAHTLAQSLSEIYFISLAERVDRRVIPICV